MWPCVLSGCPVVRRLCPSSAFLGRGFSCACSVLCFLGQAECTREHRHHNRRHLRSRRQVSSMPFPAVCPLLRLYTCLLPVRFHNMRCVCVLSSRASSTRPHMPCLARCPLTCHVCCEHRCPQLSHLDVEACQLGRKRSVAVFRRIAAKTSLECVVCRVPGCCGGFVGCAHCGGEQCLCRRWRSWSSSRAALGCRCAGDDLLTQLGRCCPDLKDLNVKNCRVRSVLRLRCVCLAAPPRRLLRFEYGAWPAMRSALSSAQVVSLAHRAV